MCKPLSPDPLDIEKRRYIGVIMGMMENTMEATIA